MIGWCWWIPDVGVMDESYYFFSRGGLVVLLLFDHISLPHLFFFFFLKGKENTLGCLLVRGILNASDTRIEGREELLQFEITKLELTK